MPLRLDITMTTAALTTEALAARAWRGKASAPRASALDWAAGMRTPPSSEAGEKLATGDVQRIRFKGKDREHCAGTSTGPPRPAVAAAAGRLRVRLMR